MRALLARCFTRSVRQNMAFIRKLLPNTEELRKLWIEVWKYFLILGLAAIVLFVPSLRSTVVGWIVSGFEYAAGSHDVSGWVIVALGLVAMIGAISIARFLGRAIRPAVVRRFREADYERERAI